MTDKNNRIFFGPDKKHTVEQQAEIDHHMLRSMSSSIRGDMAFSFHPDDMADMLMRQSALIPTHAAEPVPVAVEGAPERVWLGPAIGPQGLSTWNVEGRLAGDWDTEISGLNYPKEAVRYIRADLAPTGNTALVEWCNEYEALVRGCIDLTAKEEATALLWINNFRAALSQPAAPQPTPEVEALVKAAVDWWEDRVPRDDAERKLCSEIGKYIRAALARGSVAEKGERS